MSNYPNYQDDNSYRIEWLEKASIKNTTIKDYTPSTAELRIKEQSSEEFVKNSLGGVKGDGAKPRPTLLLKSCNKAVQSVIDVLEYGARKYSADNWKKVEHARYLDAAFRHMIAYTSGEVNDSESGKHHLAHAMCCILFMLQMDLDKDTNAKTT